MASSKILFTLVAALCAITAVSIQAQTQLTSGAGPGTVTLTVDGWGMFGGCPSNQTAHSDAQFTNSAGAGPFLTTCYSSVLLEDLTGCPAPGRTLLSLADSLYGQFPAQAANPAVNVLTPGRHVQMVAPATVCGLQFTVDQLLTGPDPAGGSFESSTLKQTHTITNTGATPRTFTLVRFLDGDLSPVFGSNDGGASRRFADCGVATPPFVSNNEWIFEFDSVNTPGVALAVATEGIDATGQPVHAAAYRLHASAVGHPAPAFVSAGAAFCTNAIDNDIDGDLLVGPSELVGDFAMFQSITLTAPPGATVTAVFRTRWMSLIASSPASVQQQARDVTCMSSLGNHSSSGVGPILCVNGTSPCASVAANAPFNISLGATAAGPSPAHYIVFGTFGQPILGTACGSPQAADASLWGPPIGLIGLGGFPVSSPFAPWNGGGGALGLAIISSLPGLALLNGPLATGTIAPCGGTILVGAPGLPAGLSVTLQAAILDNLAPPLFVSLSNTVTLAIGCPCQTH